MPVFNVCFGVSVLFCIVDSAFSKSFVFLLCQRRNDALLVIPFVFIAQGRAWNRKTILFIIAVVIAVLFVDRFTDILDTMLQDTQYKNVVSDWESWQDDGTNILRVLVYSIPAVLSLIGIRFIRNNNPCCVHADTAFYTFNAFCSIYYAFNFRVSVV